jgi:hypothetical protein
MEMMTTPATAGARDQFARQVRRGMFNPVARHLRKDFLDDRLAEGIGMAFEQYARSVAAGRPMEDALLVHACRMRAIDLGRRLAGADGARPKTDVFDERNYREGRVEILRLDGILDEEEDEEQGLLDWAELDALDPARELASAIDLETWLGGLGTEDRTMLALRQAGHTLGGIGAAMGRSTSAVFARLRALGRELAERTGVAMESGS